MASEVQKGKGKAKAKGSESENDKEKEKASWDSEAHAIFVDICVAEVRVGNRTSTHFNATGWKNVVMKFNEATGRDYIRTQLKNHWDSTRREWLLWESLVGNESTGLGWDPSRQTVTASDKWWEDKIQRFPGVAKFRVKGLDHAFKLDELYRDVAATGARAWAPTSGQMPPLYQQSSGVGDEASADSDDDDSEGDNAENVSTQGNHPIDMASDIRKRTVSGSSGKQDKRGKKVTAATRLLRKLDRICDAVETRSSSTSYLRTDKPGCSINEVLELMATIPECPLGCELYMAGTRLFVKRESREMFVGLPNHNIRLVWLKQESLFLSQPSNRV